MGDWAGEERSGCLLLRELPPRPTQRTCKVSTDLEQKTTALDLTSFPGDHDEQQLQLRAFTAAWGAINNTIKELREQHLAPVFQQLQQWAAASAPALQQHPSGVQVMSASSAAAAAGTSQAVAAVAGVGSITAADLRQLPTAVLSVASSSNTADTYAHLIATLQAQGHPVAVVSAREAAAGLSAVINSAMRRFLNSPTAADDMPALLAWWHDEWQRMYGAAAGINSVAAAAAPAAAGQRTPGSKARSRAAAGDALDMDLDGDMAHPAAAAGVGAVTPPRTATKAAAAAAATPATASRELRVRPAPKTPGRPGGSSAAVAQIGACSSLGVPVLVLQEADGGDLEALEELVVALSEARTAGLPIVLVLGVSSSPACLLQLLPNALLRRVSLHSLALPPARQQLVQVYRQLLLCEPALLLGPQLSSWLLQHFRDADCSASMAERVMQLACVEHFRTQPLSCLTAAATSGSRTALAKAVAALPQQQLTRCCQALLAHPSSALAGDGSSGMLPPDSSSSKRSPARTVQPNSAATAAAVEKLQAFLHPAGGKQQRADKAASVLEEAVWGAMQAFERWRLGVLLLHMLAEFTGLASRDASLQLPSLFSTASQQHFLHSSKRGSLSPCGHLLLKLLGNSSSSGSSSRSGVLAVRDLSDADCLQLLERLLHVVAAGGQEQQQQQLQQKDGGKQGKQQQRLAAGGSAVAGIVISDSENSSSYSDNDSDAGEKPDSATDSVLGSCEELQQLQQALAALQAAAAGSAAAPGMLAAAAAADGDDAAMLTSPQKKQKRHHKQQDNQQQQEDVLAAFAESFAALLAPLPELLGPTTAAGPRNGLLSSSAAAAAPGTPGSVSTPVRKVAAGRGTDTLPTPGGLASALRRHVRFAPDTPHHAASKAGAAGSNMSTPDDAVAVAGHIKTPSKKVSKPAQPRKSLFGAPAAGPAAAGAAAAAADGGKVRKKRGEKQKDEEGEIAGTSAAALAAAVAAASGSAAGAASAASKATNKRSQRLMQLMAASGPAGAAGGSNSPGSGGGSGSSTPVSGSRRVSSSSRGMLSTPPPVDADTAAAAASSPEMPLSPRGRASSRQRGSVAAAAAAAAGDGGAAGMLMSPRGGARGTSRLSRQSQPQHGAAAAAAADEAGHDDEMAVDEQQPQQQKKGKGKAEAAAVQAEAAVPRAASCSAALASLLSAVIPKLLLPWCCPSTSSSGSGSTTTNSSSSALASPLATAGAAAFVYNDLDHVSTLLCAAPRCAVHAALTDPAQRMPGHPQHLGSGWEDTCLAYMLLQQQLEDGMAVADWFGLFCQAQGIKGFSSAADEAAIEAEEDGVAAPGTGRAARARARQGRKARGYAEARDSAAAAAAQAPSSSKKKAGGSNSRDQATPKSAAKKRGSTSAAAEGHAGSADDQQQQVDQEELMAAAARFCQSAAELQLLGVWKASKRRRLAAVTRMFAPEGPGMVLRGAAGGSAAAAALESLPDHDHDY